MDLSGIIFVVLAVAWAVYLVPKALRHHDEVARTRSVDRFSTAMRVLARREPVDRRNARLVVTPARPVARMIVPARPQPSVAARRAAARSAARRRRHVVVVLVALDLVVVVLASLAVTPWWTVAVPAALILLFLVLARAQVRRENDASWTPAAVAARVSEDSAAQVPSPSHDREFPDDEDTVQLAMSQLQTVAVSVETVDGESLWDPLPVTLPTYVNKARAARTVRTIDLGAPGAWTSGRDESDTALVEETVAAESAQTEAEAQADQRKAVGS